MREGMEAREAAGLHRRGPGVVALMHGRYRKLAVDRASGALVDVSPWQNTIQAAGIERVLDLCLGDSSDHFNQSTELRLYSDAGSTLARPAMTCDSGYPSAPSPSKMVWRWSDISVDTYTVQQARVVSPGGVVFSIANPGWGSKPNTQNWIYEYELTLTAAQECIQSEGLEAILLLMTNQSTAHWGSAARLEIVQYDDPAGLPPQDRQVVDSDLLNLDANFPSRAGTRIRWEFTAHDGEAEFRWDDARVYPTGVSGVLLRGGLDKSGCGPGGTKGGAGSHEWTYRYDLTLSPA